MRACISSRADTDEARAIASERKNMAKRFYNLLTEEMYGDCRRGREVLEKYTNKR